MNGKKTKQHIFVPILRHRKWAAPPRSVVFHKRTEMVALLGEQSPRPLAPDWLMK